MTQSNFNLPNTDGATFRSNNNTAHQAHATWSSGSTAPGTTYPYQVWIDTANGLLKRRNASNTAWITEGNLDGSNPLELVTSGLPDVGTLSDLQSISIGNLTTGDVRYMRGRTSDNDGGEGVFVWDGSDLSTEVGNDEVTASEGDGGIYVAPASDKTGASGAWVRAYKSEFDFDIRAYGAAADGTDDYTAIEAMRSSLGYVVLPQGVTVGHSTTIRLEANEWLYVPQNTTLEALAGFANDVPSVWLYGQFAEIYGEGETSTLLRNDHHNRGIIRIGQQDMTTEHGNVDRVSVHDLNLVGPTAYGVTSGSPAACIAAFCPQLDNANTVYFARIYNISGNKANNVLLIRGFCNAWFIDNIWSNRVGNDGVSVNNYPFRSAIWLDGAQETQVTNVFNHFASGSYAVAESQFDNTSVTGGKTHTPIANQCLNISNEPSGTDSRVLFVDYAAGMSSNYLQGVYNSGADATVINDADGAYWRDNQAIINGRVLGMRVSRAQEFRQDEYQASRTKKDSAAGSAGVSFSLANQEPGGSYNHGFIYIKVSADTGGVSNSDAAWFLYGASALNQPYPTNSVLVDSGGNTGTFTVSLSGGTLSISSSKDNMVATVEYANPIGDVRVT